MAARTFVVSAVCFAAITALYLLTTTSSQYNMAYSALGSRVESLEVELTKQPSSPLITVTIHNNDPDHIISLLTWDTPLDPQAINTGILHLEDAETGEAVPSPDMMLNRMLPPARDSLVEIAPFASITKDIALQSPWIPTDGKSYRVQMRGNWRAAWAKPSSRVTDEELSAMSGDRALRGSFCSESIEMQLQQE